MLWSTLTWAQNKASEFHSQAASTTVSLNYFLVGQGAAFSVLFLELLTQINALQLKVQVCSNTPPLCFIFKVFSCQQKRILIK